MVLKKGPHIAPIVPTPHPLAWPGTCNLGGGSSSSSSR